ncbi:MAG: trypsin-like peptidase domain-containing protein [Planctomycetota bacterium]
MTLHDPRPLPVRRTALPGLAVTLLAGPLLAVTAAPVASAQIEAGRSDDAAERARTELYDSLRETPRETPESRVATVVKPTVVYVETEHVQAVRTFFGLQRQVKRGSGSGVVIHPTGFIVTNYHVVEGARQIRVSFDGDPQPYAAQLMSFVREEDLALLRIVPPTPTPRRRPTRDSDGGLQEDPDWRFPTVRMGTSADLMPGERVVAIGSPHGQTYTVSKGIISGLHRDVPIPGRGLFFQGLIQTDASINPGNSGGPLLNIHGELIGINTVMDSQAENIGFAIPVDRVRQVLTDILFPRANRVWLGFEVEPQGEALIVSDVWQDGPAAGAGICQGDRVVSIDGRPVRDAESLLLAKLQVDPGKVVRVGIERPDDGAVETTLRSWDELNGTFFEDIGMSVAEVQIDRSRYLMVDQVRPGSAAADLGVAPGDVIPAARPRTFRRSAPVRLSDKASLRMLLDRVPKGTEIEIDAYRDMNGDSIYQRDELLKGVLVR